MLRRGKEAGRCCDYLIVLLPGPAGLWLDGLKVVL
ncbi:Uncharacterised protein [Legionella taurinensis]|nr:Uncharacterised protein [Legionella taurinensis]